METHELLNRLEAIVDEAKTAVMATVDSEGRTHMRWMTPAVLKYRPGAIFAFSAPEAAKVEQIHAAGCAEWMFQTRDLRQIINIAGPARILDNRECLLCTHCMKACPSANFRLSLRLMQ